MCAGLIMPEGQAGVAAGVAITRGLPAAGSLLRRGAFERGNASGRRSDCDRETREARDGRCTCGGRRVGAGGARMTAVVIAEAV